VRRRTTLRILRSSVAYCGCAAAFAVPCVAQVDASLDAAASLVKYDGYLASGAAALTPAVTWQSPRTTLAARGSFLVFESGHTSIQGLLSAATFSPPVGRLRVEGAVEAGASAYAGFARFAHALGRVRLHVMGGRWGGWVGPLAGRVSRGGGAQGAWGATAGWWVRVPAGALEAAWTRLTVGDTAFSDVLGRARWRFGPCDLAGSVGGRVASRGGGRGVYGDLSASMRLSEWIALVVAGGTYPSDPVRGSIPGRYLTAGVRLVPRATPRAAEVRQVRAAFPPGLHEDPARLDRAEVAVERLDGLAVLVVRASGASRVEVMGDFTDWQPVALAASGAGRYRYALGLPAGMHRFNLRLDGGPWGVPLGAGSVADEFGGSVGVLIVP
jgi:hypothetical protein